MPSDLIELNGLQNHTQTGKVFNIINLKKIKWVSLQFAMAGSDQFLLINADLIRLQFPSNCCWIDLIDIIKNHSLMQPEPEPNVPSKKGAPPPAKKQEKEKSAQSKGSAGSKGSKGSTGSIGAKKVQPVPKSPVASKTVVQKPMAPKAVASKPLPPPPPSNAQVAQMQQMPAQLSNAQVAQMSQTPSFQIPQQQMMMNRAPRAPPQRVPAVQVKQPAVFNDDEELLPELVKEKVKETKPYDLENNLLMEIKAKQKTIQLNAKDVQLLPVVINIKTKELDEEQEGDRSPIDLVCVIDISGSMAGDKIDLVRQTLTSLLEVLNERDRLCLVQFDDRAERLTPLLRNSKKNLEVFMSMINSLDSRGGTSIHTGMDLAFRVFKERRASNPVSSVFLLTDGLDGGADKRVSQKLIEHKLLETNFTINCFGFGRDHDEDLLNNISKLKDGGFYFIDKLDTVDECFASALGGLMSVVALDVEIFVTNASYKPFEGIKIKKTFGGMWNQKGVTSGYQISLAQLMAGSEKGYMLEMEIPPMSFKVEDKERSQNVLDVHLVAKDKTGKSVIKKEAKLILHMINQDEKMGDIEEDGEVMENYFRVKGAEAIEEAVNLANRGQYEDGSKKLDFIMEQISQNKRVDQKKMKPMMEQLVQSKQSCRPEIYHAVGKKQMVSNTKCFMEQKPQASSAMYSNSVQTKMVNKMKAKKMQMPIEDIEIEEEK